MIIAFSHDDDPLDHHRRCSIEIKIEEKNGVCPSIKKTVFVDPPTLERVWVVVTASVGILFPESAVGYPAARVRMRRFQCIAAAHHCSERGGRRGEPPHTPPHPPQLSLFFFLGLACAAFTAAWAILQSNQAFTERAPAALVSRSARRASQLLRASAPSPPCNSRARVRRVRHPAFLQSNQDR